MNARSAQLYDPQLSVPKDDVDDEKNVLCTDNRGFRLGQGHRPSFVQLS